MGAIARHHNLRSHFRPYRTLDLCLTLLLLIALAPVMALIAVALKVSAPKHPVIFKQWREGRHRRPFVIFKFRTMTRPGTVLQSSANDPHPVPGNISRIGRFLRPFGLDELPQLFNVLRGDMALVGPRPHSLADGDRFRRWIDHYDRRLVVCPGLTGQAQISGWRGRIHDRETLWARLACDLAYIENRRPLGDLSILAATLFRPGSWVFGPRPKSPSAPVSSECFYPETIPEIAISEKRVA